VLPDADVDFAAEHLVAAGYGSAGQRCMAISAVVAVGDVGDRLVARMRELTSKLRVGAGSDDAAEMGPLVGPDARDRVTGYVERGLAAGAQLVVDGRDLVVDGHPDGFFVGPCLFDHVTSDMDVYTDEIFGPVLVVLRAGTADEAIDLVNANPYGNGTAIFTSSGQAARVFQRRVTVGMIGVNVPIPVPMAFHSFGGWKHSLFGDHHVHGTEGIGFYTRAKVVTSRWPQPEEPSGAHLAFPTAH
jgi:malonate-semialdehyde dehydrogenase (acetylating)/methylmalonate-semialdehyde dehydrogenase